MEDSIKNGTFIIADGTPLLSSGNLRSEPFSKGWRTVASFEGGGLDRRLSDMGWTCFQKATAATVNVVGVGANKTLVKAFRKIVRGCRAKSFNCLEVTETVQKTFMGLTYVRMSARPRNIRQRP